MNGNLVAVIVTFNRLDKIEVCLDHTLALDFYKVIVVDNCSTDGTGEWLDTIENDKLVVIHNETNTGGAGGFNKGFGYAAENVPEADWVVCFDDDAYPYGDIVQVFSEQVIPEDVGSFAAAVYLPDGQISEMNRPSRNPFWHLREFAFTTFKGRYGFHLDDSSYDADGPFEVDASSFVGFFMRLSLIRSGHVGLPRAELFIYADDIIYVLQLRKAGYRHWFLPRAVFLHDCQTLVNQQDVYRPLWRVYYTFRNRLEMYRIASGLFFPVVLLIKVPKCFLTVRHYEKSERKAFLKITFVAILDGIRRNYSKAHSDIVQIAKG